MAKRIVSFYIEEDHDEILRELRDLSGIPKSQIIEGSVNWDGLVKFRDEVVRRELESGASIDITALAN